MEQYPLYALKFNGVDGYLRVPASPSLNPASFTWEVWVKMHSNTYGIMDMGSIASAYRHIEFRGNLGYFEFRSGNLAEDNYWRITSLSFTLNKWYHLVGTFEENGIMEFLVNRVSQGTRSVTSHVDVSGEDLRLGRLQWGATAYYLDGSVALARVYSRVLSRAEITHNFYNPLNPVRDGLVLFLPMVEGSGTSVADCGGQGNHGTLYGGVSWTEFAKYEIPAGVGL